MIIPSIREQSVFYYFLLKIIQKSNLKHIREKKIKLLTYLLIDVDAETRDKRFEKLIKNL